jgi:hypothetical protein
MVVMLKWEKPLFKAVLCFCKGEHFPPIVKKVWSSAVFLLRQKWFYYVLEGAP